MFPSCGSSLPFLDTSNHKTQQTQNTTQTSIKSIMALRNTVRPTGCKGAINRKTTIKFSANLFVPQQAISDGVSMDAVYSIDFDKDKIEEGSKSVVYKCIHRETGEERCVKIVAKNYWNDDANASVREEMNLLRTVDHPNIVRVFETFEDDKHYYIVMDFCRGGELRDQLFKGTGLSEYYVAVLVKTVLSSINYCFQKHGVVHLGLRPENILLEGNQRIEQLKLIDFGKSVIAPTATKLDRLIGAAAYLAPESLKHLNYSHKTDIWAVGIIAFAALSGSLPFDAESEQEALDLILNSREEVRSKEIFKEDAWAGVSDDAIDFVSKMLSFEPYKRPSAREALQHPWIRRVIEAQTEVTQNRDRVMTQQALGEVVRFQAPSKLQQAALTYIASQCLSKFDKAPIERIYQAMDLGGAGKLTKQDFQKAYSRYMGEDEKMLTQGELTELFDNVNIMGNNTIEYSEFLVAALPAEVLLTENNIQKAFKLLDKDQDSKISAEDVKSMLKDMTQMDEDFMDQYIKNKVLKDVETRNDGTISFEIFSELLKDTKNGHGRDLNRRQSLQMTPEELEVFKTIESTSIAGNTFDQFRKVFERNLRAGKSANRGNQLNIMYSLKV